MGDTLRILILEDSPVDAELNQYVLKKAGLAFEALRVETEEAFLEALSGQHPDIVLADYNLPHYDGVRALEALRGRDPILPFIFVTGAMGEEKAVEMLHQGANDYILKDRLTRLPLAVTRALDEARHKRALVESEERYRNASRSVRDAFVVMNGADGSILEWNPAAERIFGWCSEEVVGRSLHELLTPTRLQPAMRRGMAAFARTGTGPAVGRTQELPALHKDGHEFPVELSLSAYRKGDKWLAVGLVRDIRDRKEAEERLRKNQKNLAQAQQIAHLGSWELDHATGRLAWSDEVYRIFEIRPDAFGATYQAFLDAIHPEDREGVNLSFVASIEGHTLYDVEHRLLLADGRIKQVHERCETRYDDRGRPVRSIGTVQDITDQKAAADVLAHQANRAEALLNLPVVAEQMDEKTFMQYGLALAEDLTGSRAAFFHYLDEDTRTIELVTWSHRTQEQCAIPYETHYPVRQAGIWSDALRLRKPLVVNDYAAYPRDRELPDGHPDLARVIFVPVIENRQVVLLAGIGNKARDYTDLDVETVQLIANEIWRIVQRRRAAAVLAASEERYRELVKGMSDGVAVYEAVDDGRDFVLREHNRAGEQITGIPRDQALGRPITELFPGVGALGLLEVLRQVWRTGEPTELPARLYRDERIQLWVENYVFRLGGGEIVAVYSDITGRKESEEKLSRNHQTQQVLNALLQISLEDEPLEMILEDCLDILLAAPFLDLIPKGGIFLAERAELRLAAHRALPAEVLDACEQVPFGRCLCGRAADSGEIQFADCVDGRHLQVSGEAAPHGHYAVPIVQAGRVFGVLLLYLEQGHAGNAQELEFLRTVANTMAGLIERKQMEERLRKLAQAVEQSSESIAITNLNAEIEYVNETFIRNTGYSWEEAMGQNPRILHSGHTPQTSYDELWDALTHGRPWKGEFFNRRKDGSEYVEFAVITPLRQPDGTVTHYVAVKEDITEKKRLARELEQHRHHLEELVEQRTAELRVTQQEAERLARVKSEFLANMSHEIRTPLNAILGFSQTGLRDSSGRSKAQETFGRILQSGQLLLGVVDDILDFSKIEAGKLVIEQRAVRLRGLVEQVAEVIRNRLSPGGLSFVLTLGADLPATCRGDRLRLSQVLMNLLSNAVKFTERGRIELSAKRQGDELVFRVADTGIGMDREQVERLFTPFVQADSSITRKFGGTGLGLTITKRLLDLMGGSIQVDSEPGGGSRFEVRLPLVEPAGLAAEDTALDTGVPETEGTGERLAGLSILVAEDNEVNRLVLEDILSTEGCALVQVEDGALAVQRVRDMGDSPFDLVLMDIQMPVMDGYQATREIHRLAPDLPVIGLTAHALPEERARCLEQGMVDHVAKPIVLEKLVRAILDQVAAPGGTPIVARTAAPEPGPPQAGSPAPAGSDGGQIDWAGLQRQYRDRPAFLSRLLTTVLSSLTDKPARLRDLASGRDFPPLVREAHGLKGMASALIPDGLRELAARLENDARQERQQALDRARALADRLEALVGEIRAHLPDDAAGNAPASSAGITMDRQALCVLMSELETLLEADDTRAIGCFNAVYPQLRAVLDADAERLGRQIAAFDFAVALATVRRLLNDLADVGDTR